MKFISNSKYGEPVESGTIYRCEYGSVRVTIHKIIHLDGWHLSCSSVGISEQKLKSESLMSAINEGIDLVSKAIDKMKCDTETIKSEDIEISRY
jgi:hypothetical protein